MIIRIGTRPSPLALKQVEEAMPILTAMFPEAEFQIKKIKTLGDKDKATPLSQVDGSDFFTKEIDAALLNEEIDVAVHSAKDLPDRLPKGLKVILETESISQFDAVVARGQIKLSQFPKGSIVGASSLRRKEQIRSLWPDLKIVDVRGNIRERINLVDTGKIDALIVAHAALIRLDLEYRISEMLPLELCPPHPKQGRLALAVKEERWQKLKSL